MKARLSKYLLVVVSYCLVLMQQYIRFVPVSEAISDYHLYGPVISDEDLERIAKEANEQYYANINHRLHQENLVIDEYTHYTMYDYEYIQIQDYLNSHAEEITILAKIVYAEGNHQPLDQKAAIIWCILNRYDNGHYGKTIKAVATAQHQFAYHPYTPVMDYNIDLAIDVLTRWQMEKIGYEEVGRTLPKDYLWFEGYNGRNHFRNNYKKKTSYVFKESNSPY